MIDPPTSQTESALACDCEDSMRSACVGRSSEYASGKRFCVLHLPNVNKREAFQKAFQSKIENKDFNFQGAWFPDALSFSDSEFEWFMDFSSATFESEVDFSFASFNGGADFTSAIFRTKVDFNSAAFSEMADFTSATFNGEADFSSAAFSGKADFAKVAFGAEVDFGRATFSEKAVFDKVSFGAKAKFASATFSAEADFRFSFFSAEADFDRATFSAKTDFRLATFSAEAVYRSIAFGGNANFALAAFKAEADFRFTTFTSDVDFSHVTFGDYIKFEGKEKPLLASSLVLKFAKIEKPDRVSFHTLALRPNWFVNIDARRFAFTNVHWDWRKVSKEIQSVMIKGYASPHSLLAITCRQLGVNAEENNRYEEASKFRYMAMEATRLETWKGFAPWKLSWWYWLASGYGERSFQALIVLVGMLFMFGLLYHLVGFARWEPRVSSEADAFVAKRDEAGAPLPFNRTFTYSAAVMTLQRPEPRPATTAAQAVVVLETILGPVQAALLALAIRRKFMR